MKWDSPECLGPLRYLWGRVGTYGAKWVPYGIYGARWVPIVSVGQSRSLRYLWGEVGPYGIYGVKRDSPEYLGPLWYLWGELGPYGIYG